MLSLPYPILPVLPRDFADYVDLGIDGYVLEFKPEEWGLYGANANLIGRLSWNPTMDAAAFLHRHRADLYGPAAPHMEGYYAELGRVLRDTGPCVGHYDLGYTERATEQLLQPAAEHLGRAMAMAAPAERRYRDGVVAAQVGLQMLLRVGEWRRLVRRAREAPADRRASFQAAALAAGENLVEWAQHKSRRDLMDLARLRIVVSAEAETLRGG